MEKWKIKYSDYKPEDEKLREALCTLGNGYFATRGSIEGSINSDLHYPATYLAGGYNRLETEIQGKVIENEDLVRWPDWTILKFKPENGEWFDIESVDLILFEQELDLKEGYLERKILFRDKEERETMLISRRIVSMYNMHLGAIEWQIIPQNWSGKVTIHSALDGGVENNGVARYRALNSKHLKLQEKGNYEEDSIFLKVKSNQSEIVMAQAARTSAFFENYNSFIERETFTNETYVDQ